MKVEKIISVVDAMKPNDINEETKLFWLNEVEGRVGCEIRRKKVGEVRELVSVDDELSVLEPYSRIYSLYLIAMRSFVCGDYENYTKTVADFEHEISNYSRYVIRNR